MDTKSRLDEQYISSYLLLVICMLLVNNVCVKELLSSYKKFLVFLYVGGRFCKNYRQNHGKVSAI